MENTNPSTEGGKFRVPKVELSDKSQGFIELLRQLTVCDSISDKEFEERFKEISMYGDDHVICVMEDETSSKIIASGSVFIEKFTRNCGKVGHIEDVVVDARARGMRLGKEIEGYLADHARSMGCYKVILDCSDDKKVFYEKCGFKQKEIQMVRYFV
ncbi:Glucosamine 6-phosphate N-acetyltransferase [Hibiscus syriacus]|uniref:Glucosamine 6-phosphate N-acetyltransferase n=1 Tax=Hibiscus syriacus TaxID=106335 RepID=A0A6A3B5H0_HIBSY|nr:glucosamine 6-phosphate N-acetyltransferase-like [Hibiscus syriacus]KAE8711118.1 Glucosamine 6-phosphate N-acetyltransferase [Hibiscus syriacus]